MEEPADYSSALRRRCREELATVEVSRPRRLLDEHFERSQDVEQTVLRLFEITTRPGHLDRLRARFATTL